MHTPISHVAFCQILQLLNQIVCELPPEHPLSNVRPLRDSLGHTPLQVWCVFAVLTVVPTLPYYNRIDVYYSLLCLVTNNFIQFSLTSNICCLEYII